MLLYAIPVLLNTVLQATTSPVTLTAVKLLMFVGLNTLLVSITDSTAGAAGCSLGTAVRPADQQTCLQLLSVHAITAALRSTAGPSQCPLSRYLQPSCQQPGIDGKADSVHQSLIVLVTTGGNAVCVSKVQHIQVPYRRLQGKLKHLVLVLPAIQPSAVGSCMKQQLLPPRHIRMCVRLCLNSSGAPNTVVLSILTKCVLQQQPHQPPQAILSPHCNM